MYYGKYDYYILVDASNEIEATTGNYNEEVLYGVSRKRNYLYKNTNIRKS